MLRPQEHGGAPWGGWGKNRPNPGLTMRDLARLLRPYGIGPRRSAGRTDGKGYKCEQFEDAWRRYVPPSDPGDEA